MYYSGLSKNTFPEELKARDVCSLFKKDNAFSKKSYRTIKVLLPSIKNFRKIDARPNVAICPVFLIPISIRVPRGMWCTGCTTEFCGIFQEIAGNGEVAEAVLSDLSKAFDCLNHELLIAELDVYGLSRSALLFVYSYIHERNQRVKVNGFFSTWANPS